MVTHFVFWLIFLFLKKAQIVKRLLSILLSSILFIACIKQKNHNKAKMNPYFGKAYDYRDAGNLDSAFSYFNKAKDVFSASGDKFSTGKCLVNMAFISSEKNDYLGAQEIGLQASKLFNIEDTAQHKFISYNYHTLGLVTYQLNNHIEAQNFYDNAIKYVKNDIDRSLYLNSKGKAFEEMGNYQEALKNYNKAISIKGISKLEYARTLSNSALTKWLENRTYNPLPELFKALEIRRHENDLLDLNASYAYIADYYATKNVDSSIFYAKQMLLVTTKTKRAKDKLIALRKLSLVAKSTDYKSYLKSYLFLLDSLDIANNNAKNQFALIRFQSEEHKSNLLLAQNENIKKRNNIIQLLFVASLLASLLVLGY
ncbi:MAG: tetratricopeptide repeat protein, partial [Chitinophagaceae bacterium]